MAQDYEYILPEAIVTSLRHWKVQSTPVITTNSSDTEISAAFQALGTLQVRAIYVSGGQGHHGNGGSHHQ